MNTDEQHERAGVALEKFVFVSAFIARKLMESKKLSDELEGKALHLQGYPRINHNKQIDFLNWHQIDRFYDFAKSKTATLLPRDLFNTIIHSFVFTLVTSDMGHGYEGFLFNSDRTKDAIIYKVSFRDYFELMQSVREDDIVSSQFNRKTGRFQKSAHHR